MPFDLVITPINKGITRLEASAGTGKTYALVGLFLRLLLEFKVPATEILVVTYTKAATAELRDRIRHRLREALSAFEGQSTDDDFLKALTSRVPHENAVQSLHLALELIDEVSIDTIHAFCQRTLQERAFESGMLFDVELVPDQGGLFRGLAGDYFRMEIYSQAPLLAAAAIWKGITPDVLARMLNRFVTYPNLRLNPKWPSRNIKEIANGINEGMAKLVKFLEPIHAAPGVFLSYFTAKPRWATGAHAKPECISEKLSVFDGLLMPGAASTEMWDAIEFFSTSAIEEATGKAGNNRKPRPQPEPELFGVCESLVQLASDYALAHRLSFLQWALAEMRARKQQAKQQSYDDLITRFADALDGSSGEALARSVRRKYQAALIDEFQDTDPLQWKIFDRVFGKSEDHWLFLIGDPKQAIYGFRGADVSTYIQAASTARDKHDLDTNYRSEAGLVRAINTLFTVAGKQAVFVEAGINFEEVKPAGKADQTPFTMDGNRPPPFQVWHWESAQGPIGVGKAINQLPVAVAAETSRLLSTDSCYVNGRRIQPRDIAVLVESHQQASSIKRALHKLGIPAVELATESVLGTDEARELQWILMGILEPGRDNLLKSALTTNTIGWTADKLLEESSHEERWQRCLLRFAGYREAWGQNGFFYMFSCLLREENVIGNLLRFADGERRITNLLHLAELLETASKSEHLGPLRLLQWLEARRLSDDAAPEEFQLRLESDEDAVRVVTIHAAKGLEYPVVFCPFFQKDADLRPIRGDDGKHQIKKVVLYHDPQTNHMVWDLNSAPVPANEQRAQKEQLAEKMRLLYVALTRAKNRCYLASVQYMVRNSAKPTPLAWLLYPQKDTVNDPVASIQDPPAPGQWKARWQSIANASVDPLTQQPTVAVAGLSTEEGAKWIPPHPDAETFTARSCCRPEIHPSWCLSSFSLLSSRIAFSQPPVLEADQPDHDETAPSLETPDAAEPAVSPAAGIFALPAGARTGECLHKILEHLDFAKAASPAETTSLVQGMMKTYGFTEEPQFAAVSTMLGNLCATPLDIDKPGFTLARIPKERRLAELEFHFPAGDIDGSKLIRLIRGGVPGRNSPSVPGPSGIQVHSFLKGFIDLVFEFDDRFYVLDWKSNHLGNRHEDYHPEAMNQTILESYYDLQYHLYTLALDKYLRLRLPGYQYETHFGGVRYLFLRGVSPERPDLGIYRARPSYSVIQELSKLMSTIGEEP